MNLLEIEYILNRGTMPRKRNTTISGRSFNQETIEAVWNKSQVIESKNSFIYRSDILGNTLYRGSYGKQSIMGWEIDHIKPVSKGGTDDIDNLQILNTGANIKKGDIYPWP